MVAGWLAESAGRYGGGGAAEGGWGVRRAEDTRLRPLRGGEAVARQLRLAGAEAIVHLLRMHAQLIHPATQLLEVAQRVES